MPNNCFAPCVPHPTNLPSNLVGVRCLHRRCSDTGAWPELVEARNPDQRRWQDTTGSVDRGSGGTARPADPALNRPGFVFSCDQANKAIIFCLHFGTRQNSLKISKERA